MNQIFPVRALCLCISLCALSPPGWAGPVEDLLKQGDVYDEKFEPAAALKFYLPAEKLDPANVSVLLRVARQYRHLMADATAPEEKIRLGGVGRSYAERAAALAPNDPEAQISIALSCAKMVPVLATRERIQVSHSVKTAVDKALALDPKNDVAWHLLGCWHQRLADLGTVKRTMARLVYGKLPEATNDEAVKCLKRAIAINPDRLIHHIELGRTYAQMGEASNAKRCIQTGLAMPEVGKDDPEAKRRGRETLSKLQ